MFRIWIKNFIFGLLDFGWDRISFGWCQVAGASENLITFFSLAPISSDLTQKLLIFIRTYLLIDCKSYSVLFFSICFTSINYYIPRKTDKWRVLKCSKSSNSRPSTILKTVGQKFRTLMVWHFFGNWQAPNFLCHS